MSSTTDPFGDVCCDRCHGASIIQDREGDYVPCPQCDTSASPSPAHRSPPTTFAPRRFHAPRTQRRAAATRPPPPAAPRHRRTAAEIEADDIAAAIAQQRAAATRPPPPAAPRHRRTAAEIEADDIAAAIAQSLLAAPAPVAPPATRRRMMPPREPISEIDALIRQAAAADPFDDIETLMAIEASIETAKTTATAAATTTPPTVAAAPGTCCICLDKPPTHLFAPCLHKCICDGCARRAGSKKLEACPICRTAVTGLVKTTR